MSDTSVKAVLINIFGGILRCDVLLAQGVIERSPTSASACPSSFAWKAQTSRSAADAEGQQAQLHSCRFNGRGR